MKVYRAAQVVSRRCLWCQKQFWTLKLEVGRGRGDFDSGKCKAMYDKAHGGRSPNQKAKQEKADSIIARAIAEENSFAEYDRICAEEDSQ